MFPSKTTILDVSITIDHYRLMIPGCWLLHVASIPPGGWRKACGFKLGQWNLPHFGLNEDVRWAMDGPWLTSWVMMGHDSYGIKWLVYPTIIIGWYGLIVNSYYFMSSTLHFKSVTSVHWVLQCHIVACTGHQNMCWPTSTCNDQPVNTD